MQPTALRHLSYVVYPSAPALGLQSFRALRPLSLQLAQSETTNHDLPTTIHRVYPLLEDSKHDPYQVPRSGPKACGEQNVAPARKGLGKD